MHLFTNALCSHNNKQIWVTYSSHYVVTLIHRVRFKLLKQKVRIKKRTRNEGERKRERMWREKGGGDERWQRGWSSLEAAGLVGGAKLYQKLFSSVGQRRGRRGPSAADIFPGNYAHIIIVSTLLPWEVNIKGLQYCNYISGMGREG